MSAQSKQQRHSRRKVHIRKKLRGTPERPRLSVFRSLKHIYVQAIDDLNGRTLASACSLNDEVVKGAMSGEGGKKSVSVAVGKVIAMRLKEKNVERAVFDRNGYLYHGRVKALADGAREAGLQL